VLLSLYAHTHIWDGLYEREEKKKNRKEESERNVRVMIVSLLTEKDGRVMDI
jgi:hypothetical protein